MSEEDRDRPERLNPAGMARSLGMSRQRLYQLMDQGIFPQPSRDAQGRPFFSREQQELITKAYRSNCGVNGNSCFFRPRKNRSRPQPSSERNPQRHAPRKVPTEYEHSALLTAVRQLGLHRLNKTELDRCLASLFPEGQLPADKKLLVRKVFLHLHDRTPTDQ
jgi:hypothetical protein